MSCKITPFIWLNNGAKEAADLYLSIFSGKIRSQNDNVAGNDAISTVSLELEGLPIVLFNGGPMYRPNASISFTVICDTNEEVDEVWEKFMKKEGAQVLMPLKKYYFSERYGWLNDKFGVSWQIIQGDSKLYGPKITPTLLFVQKRAEEAAKFYVDVFKQQQVTDNDAFPRSKTALGNIKKYDDGAVNHGEFTIHGQKFYIMDYNPEELQLKEEDCVFSAGLSFSLACKNQTEIDYIWDRFAEKGNEVACCWITDQFGVSWQVNSEFMATKIDKAPKTEEEKSKVKKMFDKLMTMKKIIISELEEAYNS